jgi:hypothetical protein
MACIAGAEAAGMAPRCAEEIIMERQRLTNPANIILRMAHSPEAKHCLCTIGRSHKHAGYKGDARQYADFAPEQSRRKALSSKGLHVSNANSCPNRPEPLPTCVWRFAA